jgi:tetratricopeptide (TPR) repeat protein
VDPAVVVPKLQQFIKENSDYPRLEAAYSTLLSYASTLKNDPATTHAIADEALTRFPNPSSPARAAAIRAKLAAYRNAKDNTAASAFGLKLLETETSPSLLEVAALFDKVNGPKLFEKAIAERAKDTDTMAAPRLDVLRWEYAQILIGVGRRDEALKLALEVVDETKKSLADLDALPNEDARQQRRAVLQSILRSRCTSVAAMLSTAGQYQRALDYIQFAEEGAPDLARESVSDYEAVRARIYGKMGKPDLELDSYARAFSARMDIETRDLIRGLSAKLGRSPDEAFARARELRTKRATPIKGFELKTLDGPTATLESLRAKVTLVNFFFPT